MTRDSEDLSPPNTEEQEVKTPPAADQEEANEPESPLWSTNTKIIVAVGVLILLVAVAVRFTGVIRLVTIAAILAYLLNPLIAFIDTRTKISRGMVVTIVYLLVIVVVVTAVTILGAATYIQATSFVQQLPNLVNNITSYLEKMATQSEPIGLGIFSFSPANIDWGSIGNQILGLVEPVAGRSYRLLSSVATRTVSVVGDLFFIFVLSIYLAAEIPKLGGYVVRVARAPGYQRDAQRLMQLLTSVWSSYLRGQMLLGLSVGFASWVGLAILGVQNSIALGILSGFLEFVPNIGPIIGAIIAVIVAFFQPDNYLGLTSMQLALLTLGWMFIVQQLENNLLVPRIMGNALNLHPLLVLLGVLMGASLAGILGAILAAPILASIKLIGVYVWRKMFDLPPFPDDQEPKAEEKPPKRSWRDRISNWLSRFTS